MSIRNRRWVLLSSSALALACCLAGAARSQTAAEPPPAPAAQTPAATPPAAQTPPAPTPTPTPTPPIVVPPVTVTAPPPPRRPTPARPGPAAPRVTPAAAPPVAPATTPRPPSQPYAPLSTITSGQIQQIAGAEFRRRVLHATGRYVVDIRARRQPADPARPGRRSASACRRTASAPATSPTSARIMRCRSIRWRSRRSRSIAARRRCATVRRRSAASSRRSTTAFPTMAPFGGVAAELKAGLNTRRQRLGERRCCSTPARATPRSTPTSPAAAPATTAIPSYPYLFPPDPPPPVNGRQPNSALTAESASAGGSWLFDGGYAGAAISRFTTDYQIPGLEASENARRTSGWSRPRSPARANSVRAHRRSRRSATGPA